MAHEIWQARLEAYAEGTLRWPLTWMVESHTKHCQECRRELRAQLAFFRELDELVFSPQEVVNTAVLATHRDLWVSQEQRKPNRFVSLALTGAAAFIIVLAMLPLAWSNWINPGVTVVAASGWSEGVATTVPVEDDFDEAGTVLTNPSGVGRGTGVTVPVLGAEEWRG